jgi:hypothetical protein
LSQLEVNEKIVIRRRRTRRHRRNRLIRRALMGAAFTLAFAFAFVVLQHVSPSLFRASHSIEPDPQAIEASRNAFLFTQQEALHQMQMEDRPVYPYSVVAGGVKDARELKWMADHDPVVRAHYAGFDYDHARVVRLVLARTAYVSYRIGNKVYWTRHRISLHKGEALITDGRITARARCGNRVEEVPQQANAVVEPPPAKFDEPVQPAVGTAEAAPPVPFQTSLLNRPPVPGLGPAPPLSIYDPFTPSPWVPISPPPLPGVCDPGKKPTKGGGAPVAVEAASSTTKKKSGGTPCGGPGGEVPEPGTWLLVASGITAMCWMARRRFARTQP